MDEPRTDNFAITDWQHLVDLWLRVYNEAGRPDWSPLLPYYAPDVHFTDTVQELHGLDAFRDMVERLAARSNELRMAVRHAAMQDRVIFIEWEMTILFRKTRPVVMHGISRMTLNEAGKIVDQWDMYDLWGAIFDNIPGLNRLYRKFMQKVFG